MTEQMHLASAIGLAFGILGLLLSLSWQNWWVGHTRGIIKTAVLLAALSLVAFLLLEPTAAQYHFTYTALLLLMLFSYGQRLFSVIAASVFGSLSALAVLLIGFNYVLSEQEWLLSLVILGFGNVIGYLQRSQLEGYVQHSVSSQQQTETLRVEKNLYLCQLSHNLRQYVQTISCYSAVLEHDVARSSSPELMPTLQKLGYVVDELNNAFNHVLNIAHIDSGQQTPQISNINVNVLLDALEAQFAPLAAKKGIKLIVRRRKDSPYAVYSDANLLHQILANLLDNAIKYTIQGWVLLACVKISRSQLKIHVWDTGTGIHETQHGEIFKEFYRAGRRLSDSNIVGLGIGLASALKTSQLLPRHQLDYVTRLQHGSHFSLSLPVNEVNARSKLPAALQQDLAGSFVLAVDDDQALLTALTAQLKSWGCLVQAANSLEQCIDRLADTLRPPDLVITDFYLDAQKNAHDIIRSVYADCGPVPILILSAHGIPAAEKAKCPDSTLILRKPANAALLMTTMAQAMGKA